MFHPVLAFLLTQLVENNFDGGGPNARHNLIGIYFFGVAGFLFSFVIGMVIGLLRKVIFLKNNGLYGRYLMVFAVFASVPFFSDAPFAIGARARMNPATSVARRAENNAAPRGFRWLTSAK